MPKLTRGFFVTGTDTGVGKTHTTALITSALRSADFDAVAMKPFCCGERDDAEILLRACEGAAAIELINPVWLRAPAAPYAASLIENRTLDLETARGGYQRLAESHSTVLVEGVGGWRVPLTADFCASDFAKELELPVLVVCANRLGMLNHTQLTVDAIIAKGLHCAGVIINHPTPPGDCPAVHTNAAVLEQLLPVPILGEIAYGALALPHTVLEKIKTLMESPTGLGRV
jgi:dethiobiotin synthetase